MPGTVTVKVAEEVAPAAKMTVLEPAAAFEGTVKSAPLNEPEASVVVVPVTVTDAPSKVAVIGVEAVNLVPETDTTVLAGPKGRFKLITG